MQHRCFFCKLCEIFKCTFYAKHQWLQNTGKHQNRREPWHQFLKKYKTEKRSIKICFTCLRLLKFCSLASISMFCSTKISQRPFAKKVYRKSNVLSTRSSMLYLGLSNISIKTGYAKRQKALLIILYSR